MKGFEQHRNRGLIVGRLGHPGETEDLGDEVPDAVMGLGIGVPASFGPDKHQALGVVYYTTVRGGRFVLFDDWKRWRP